MMLHFGPAIVLKAFPMSVNVVCGCELLRLCMYLLRVFKLGVLFSTVHKHQLCSLVLGGKKQNCRQHVRFFFFIQRLEYAVVGTATDFWGGNGIENKLKMKDASVRTSS